MAPQLATKRLLKELADLQKDPPPGILAEPKHESDILVWHYALRGPKDTPYERGVYIGKIKFPPQYPLKAPSLYMLTPSGRFEPSVRLCLSMSDFHPESWNPTWSVATIIQGIQSFMASEELTTGGLTNVSETERIKFAAASHAFNSQHYGTLFGGDLEAAFAKAEAARAEAEKNRTVVESSAASQRRANARRQGRTVAKANEAKQQEEANQQQQQQQADSQATKEEATTTTTTISEQEAERRRKRNAKKRAKQKAKKQAAKDAAAEEEEESGDNTTGLEEGVEALAMGEA